MNLATIKSVNDLISVCEKMMIAEQDELNHEDALHFRQHVILGEVLITLNNAKILLEDSTLQQTSRNSILNK